MDDQSLTEQIIGAAIEVHRHLGPGFLESVYEQALCHELFLRNVHFEVQKEIMVSYKGVGLKGQRLDLLLGERIIVELKAVDELAPIHEAQLLSYLRATKLYIGLLMNFNVRYLKQGLKRLVV